ncbi:MAG: V-type ATPase subunit [Candidatus Omnitrophica bacterium]|nr:V-type ATPase subunit [Candidatus Omnitrophota bacterium]
MTNNLDYAFAVGKIRALEKFLIRREVFEEALDADLQDALKLFVESDLYSEKLLHVSTSSQLESVLSEELAAVSKLVSRLLLDKKLLELIKPENLSACRAIAAECGSDFLSDYFSHRIDMHNIKTLLRLRLLKEPKTKCETLITSEGFLKKKELIKLYDQDINNLLHRLEYVHKRGQIVNYAFYLKGGIEKAGKILSFVSFEKAAADFLMEILKPAHYVSFGPEPVLAYYFAKENEINLIRMIILVKLNTMPRDVIRERMNTVYA